MTTVRTITEDRPSRYGGTYPARIKEVKCCGSWLRCDRFTVTCDSCYNQSGNRLASRSQWGEETGESWQDCY